MPRMAYCNASPFLLGAALLASLGTGCHAPYPAFEPPSVPHELDKVSLPPYAIEAPDVLLIDAIRLVPRPPYRVEPLDSLAIRVTGTLPDQPIQGVYSVDPDGTVNLGFGYGSVSVVGLTVEQARVVIEKHLRSSLKPPYEVTVLVAESRALQQIRGPHLVRPDGTVSLGVYGSVYVDNMTIAQARAAIEAHLAQFLVNPEISLDISGFNSKVFYIVADGAGVIGDQVTRLPMTGKLTVLDAIGLINGLPAQGSNRKIWVARPAPAGSCAELVMPVDWLGIVRRGETATNYQILPGDRIYIKAEPLVEADATLARVLAPIERVLGTTLLTNSVITSIQSISRGTGATGTGTAGVFTPTR
jgi:polysaccharide export outer membrane protein